MAKMNWNRAQGGDDDFAAVGDEPTIAARSCRATTKKHRERAGRLSNRHPKVPLETPMSVVEQLVDHERNERSAESQARLDDQPVGDQTAVTLVRRQSALVAPPSL